MAAPGGIGALERAGILDDAEFSSRAVTAGSPRLVLGAKVDRVEKGKLTYTPIGGERKTLLARRIIGADGKSSLVRGALGMPRSSRLISHMVGAVLHDLELPFEGYGHVIPGAPGPILLYRISPDSVRLLVDVPTNTRPTGRNHWRNLIAEQYGEFLPDSVRTAFLKATGDGALEFRSNRYRPRIDYGNELLCLVGDAVGFQHPLTAMGMTLGFRDAEELANQDSFFDFQRTRRVRAFVPELLAMALHEAFSGSDPGTVEVRRAIYSMWRRYPGECERTMHLLSGEITSPISFSCSLLRVMQLALAGSVDSERFRPEFIQLFRTLGSIGQILQGIVLNSSSRIPRLRAAHPGQVAMP